MRAYLPILVILLAIGGLLVLIRYLQEQAPTFGREITAKGALEDVGMQFDGVRLVGWAPGGEKRWEFQAKTIMVSKNKLTSTLKEITEGAFYHEGRPIFRVKAKEAVVQGSSENEDVTIKGGLTIVGENGAKLVTRSLEWHGYQKKFICPDPIEIAFKDLALKVERAEGDLAVREIKAIVPKSIVYRKGKQLFVLHTAQATLIYDERSKDVRIQGPIRMEGEDGLTIRTDAVEWHDRDEKIVCPTSVEVMIKHSRLIAEYFESDSHFRKIAVKRFRGTIALGELPQTKEVL